LVAESEINRAQLVHEWVAMTAGVRSFTDRVKTCASIASSAAVLVAGLAAFRRSRPVDADTKPYWLATILKGAGLVSTIWLAFRSRGHDHEKKQPNTRA